LPGRRPGAHPEARDHDPDQQPASTVDGRRFGSSFNKAKIDAKMSERDLHFNDLRGTAATKFYIAGFSMREIAETLAWEEESVEKIIRRYVGRSAAIKARIKKLETRE
jgi:DNA-directed RNA polymerase specialized sigma24 family protein